MKTLNQLRKIAILMLLVVTSSLSMAQKFTVGKLKYEIIGSAKVQVIANESKPTGDVIIPATVTYKDKDYAVNRIGYHAFEGCEQLTSITIPNSVNYIGDNAFVGCNSLKLVTIPNSVKRIGVFAFQNSSSLTAINVDEGNERYMSENGVLFLKSEKNTTTLVQYPMGKKETTYSIPNHVKTIDVYAFFQCSKLTSLMIPNSIRGIRDYAFAGCKNLTSIISKIRDIDEVYIKNYTSFLEVNQTNCKLYVPKSAKQKYEKKKFWSGFENIIGVSIELDHTVKEFKLDEKVKLTVTVEPDTLNVTFISSNDKVLTIDENGLLTAVSEGTANIIATIDKLGFADTCKVTVIDDNISVTGVTLSQTSAELKVNETVTLKATVQPSNATNKKVTWSSSNDNIAKVDENGLVTALAEGIATITVKTEDGGKTATCQVTVKKEDVVVGDKFTSGKLRYEIKKLHPAEVEVIANNPKPTGDITIPATVSYKGKDYSVIGMVYNAFYNCEELVSVEIPNSIKYIPIYSNGRSPFEGCRLLTSINVDENNANYSSEDGVLFDKAKTVLIQYPRKKKGETYTIPNSVKRIGSNSFASSSLTKVIIPNSVTSIGRGAFYLCFSLTSVVIPDSVASIESFTFYHCNSLNSLTIGNSVKSIGISAFYFCSRLTSVTIPNSVNSIGVQSFSNCHSLTSLIIGDSVKSIGSGAFYNCNSLTTVSIPNSVTSIGEEVFNFSKSLTAIISKVKNVDKVKVEKNSFEGINKSKCKLYVSKTAKKLYQNAEQWKEFNNIIGVGIELNDVFKDLKVGETFKLTTIVEPDTLNVTFISSNNKVVTIDKNGLLTAVAEGTANIVATIDALGFLDTATCEVTVTSKTTTSINNNITQNIKIYPNLVSNGFIMESSELCVLDIYNQIGKKVKTIKLTSNKQFIDVSNLQSGVYIAKVGNEVIKFVKK